MIISSSANKLIELASDVMMECMKKKWVVNGVKLMTTTFFSFWKNKIHIKIRVQIYNVKIKLLINQVHMLNYICSELNNDS